MRIHEIMTKDVRAVNSSHTLARAAQLMWDHDVGAVPVVDDDGRVIGMITDRDACMAAYIRGQPLAEIAVADAMSTDVVACGEDARADEVAELMASAMVRRMPVLDGQRRLCGVVSLTDLAQAMLRGGDVTARDVAETFAAVSAPRDIVTA